MEALDKAIATSSSDIIFCDCLGVIKSVEKWSSLSQKLKTKKENRTLLRSIEQTMRKRQELGIKPPEIIWTPSHMAQNKKLTEEMKKQVKNLRTRFKIKTIIRHNDQVDELAKAAAEKDTMERKIWDTAEKYIIMNEGQLEEGSINKIIIEKFVGKYKSKTQNNSGWGSMSNIDTRWSNDIFLGKTPEEMSSQQFIWKLRNNCLYIPARQFMRYRTQPLDCVSALSRSILNPTPECEDCTNSNPVCDMNHMWTCPSNRVRVTKYEREIRGKLKKIDPEEKIPLWAPQTMTSIHNKQFQRSDIIIPPPRKRKTVNTPNAPETPIEVSPPNKRKLISKNTENPNKKPRKSRTKSNHNPLIRLCTNPTKDTRNPKKIKRTTNKSTNLQQKRTKETTISQDLGNPAKKSRKNNNESGYLQQTPLRKTQTRMSHFITGNTKNPIIIDSTPSTNQETISRDHLLCNILKVTSIRNLKHRESMEKIWNETAIRQYRNHQRNKPEEIQIKGRATQGWIPTTTIKLIRSMAKKKRCSNESIEQITRDVIRMTIKTSQELYLKIIERNIRRRKIEGVNMKAITNTKNDYKAMRIINKKLPDNG
jgi:hypothetical protein